MASEQPFPTSTTTVLEDDYARVRLIDFEQWGVVRGFGAEMVCTADGNFAKVVVGSGRIYALGKVVPFDTSNDVDTTGLTGEHWVYVDVDLTTVDTLTATDPQIATSLPADTATREIIPICHVDLPGTGVPAQTDITDARHWLRQRGATARIGQIGHGPVIPAGALPCDGALISSITHPELTALIGAYAPDATGRHLRGLNPLTEQVGETMGGDPIVLGIGQLPAHDHSIPHGHSTGTEPGHEHGTNGVDLVRVEVNAIGEGLLLKGQPGSIGSEATPTTLVTLAPEGEHTHTVDAFTGSTGVEGGAVPVDWKPATLVMRTFIWAQPIT